MTGGDEDTVRAAVVALGRLCATSGMGRVTCEPGRPGVTGACTRTCCAPAAGHSRGAPPPGGGATRPPRGKSWPKVPGEEIVRSLAWAA
ncbi:DUF6207 family protein [Streptomyces sp. H27-G5]|nr:DUF6207 family protein [Streptomyces sp. H27-G5]MCY0921538.1 DUF6207 family protein [Streptomyces sp. H27-G5]